MKPTSKPSLYILFWFALFLTFSVSGQNLTNNWKQELNGSLQRYLSCDGSTECNTLMAESLNKVFNVKDFYSSKLGRHMVVSEMCEYLKNSAQWKLIGHAYEQKALAEAQDFANSKKAILAVYLDAEGIGNVAVILPGELNPSGSWGFSVPNSASFNPSNPDMSYIDKGLSYAFAKTHIKNVLIYGRN